MSKNQKQSPDALEVQIETLQQELERAKAQELRAKADYQNVVRRSQQEKAAVIKLATKDVMTSLLQPLMHLELAARQINDPGLDMVVQQFKKTLVEYGLEEINPIGQPFDIQTMEVVETEDNSPEDQTKAKVVAVRSKGYLLNGEVIQHAKVVIGGEK